MTDSLAARLGNRRVTRGILRARLPLLALSGHGGVLASCLLLTQSGHGRPAPLSVDLKKKKRPGAVTLTRRFPGYGTQTAKPPGLGHYRRLCLRPPIQLPFPFGIRWASELRALPHHQSRDTFSRPAKSYLTNSAKCDRQRDSAATFRILHKRLRKRGVFCAGVAGRSARSAKSRSRFRRVPICLSGSLIPLSRGRA
jgi:hypothetical protein